MKTKMQKMMQKMMQKEFRKLLLAAGGALCFGGSFGQGSVQAYSSGSYMAKCATIPISASTLDSALGMVLVEGNDKEYPNHITSFYMGKYEVTQRLWTAVMGTTIAEQQAKAGADTRNYGRGDNYPMYYVSWYEAMEFARRVSFITGRSYRLPTEKEWEYAAKGGNSPHGFDYAGSNNIDQVGWYISNTHNVTQPVGRKAACIGLYDMTGNVAEWSYDGDSSSRMIRGGSFVDPPTPYCLVTSRTGWSLDYRVFIIGFRLACSSD